jgi:hypothetical protein
MADPHGLQAINSSSMDHEDEEAGHESDQESSASSSSSSSESGSSSSSSETSNDSSSDSFSSDESKSTESYDRLPSRRPDCKDIEHPDPEVDVNSAPQSSSSLLMTINSVAEYDGNLETQSSSSSKEVLKTPTLLKKNTKSLLESPKKKVIKETLTNGVKQESKPKVKKSAKNKNDIESESPSTTIKDQSIQVEKRKVKVPGKKEKKSSKSSSKDDCPLKMSDLSLAELEVIKAIGRIKRQKQRPSFDRIYSILKTFKESFSEFESIEKMRDLLNTCISRRLLEEADLDKEEVTYREKGPGLAIVAHYARRKNATQLAEHFGVDLSLFPLDNLSPLKRKTPKKIKADKSKNPPSERNEKKKTAKKTPTAPKTPKLVKRDSLKTKKSVKKNILPLLQTPYIPEVVSTPITATDISGIPVLIVPTGLSSLALPITSFQPQPQTTQQPQPPSNVCGLCKQDGSRDTLITCSICGLSGEFRVFLLWHQRNMSFNT